MHLQKKASAPGGRHGHDHKGSARRSNDYGRGYLTERAFPVLLAKTIENGEIFVVRDKPCLLVDGRHRDKTHAEQMLLLC